MIPNENKSIVSCYRPIRLSSGSLVPCGHCDGCIIAKSKRLNVLGNVEVARPNIYPLFVLLTYDDEHLPFVHTQEVSSFQNYHSFDIFSEYGEYLDNIVLTTKETQNLNRINSIYGKFPVLCKSHVQDWIKRVRIHVSRYSNDKGYIRYMYCGEYGPTNFRPHYHILLLFQSKEARFVAYRYIKKGFVHPCHTNSNPHKSWQFGYSNCKYFHRGGCGYVTSYLTSSIKRFSLHRKISCPFFHHSNHFGQVSLEANKEFKSFVRTLFVYRKLDTETSVKLFDYTDEYQANAANLLLFTLFPKCRGFSDSDYSFIFKRYEFASKFAFTSSELASIIIDNIDDGIYSKFVSNYFDAFGYPPSLSVEDINNKAYFDYLYGLIYRDINSSVRFQKFKKFISKVLGFSVSTYTIIDTMRFAYNEYNKYLLLKDYESLQNFSASEVSSFYYRFVESSNEKYFGKPESEEYFKAKLLTDTEYLSKRDKSKKIKEKYLRY